MIVWFPGVMTPVPPVKVAEKVKEAPLAMLLGEALKSLIVGASRTVTEVV